MSTPRILLAEPVEVVGHRLRAAQRSRLAAELPAWQVDELGATTDPTYPWSDVVAMTCLDFPAVDPAALTGLQLLQCIATGVERLPVAELAARGVRVCNGAGTAAREIAEFVLARILEDAKRLPEIRSAQDARRWEPAYGEGLRGAELVLVGFGALNQAVAELAAGLGMSVRVARRTVGPVNPPGVVEQRPLTELPALLSQARYVVCALPETAETVRLLGEHLVATIRDGALLVNVGRGSVLDPHSIAAACASGRIRAALDVFDDEPLPPDDPLWTTPGVRVSPHCASVPARALAEVAELFVDNLHRLRAGTSLINQVAGPAGPIKEHP